MNQIKWPKLKILTQMARIAKSGKQNPVRDWPQNRIGKRERPEDTANLIKIGESSHPVKNTDLLVIRLNQAVVPYFSAGIYAGGSRRIASVHEVFGKFNDDVYCSIRLENGQSPSDFPVGSEFRADKFKCLTFDRVKGAGQVSGVSVGTNKNVPKPEINRQRSSKYRTNVQNERIRKYAEGKVRENNRIARTPEGKRDNYRRTVEKRGAFVQMNKRVKFTD
ncbi:H/ACA ribonucleoprotein complex subunit 1 [Nematocida homosporus]|uniref:H/ACA ribonucleoprotein complex subunit 1 n=1 Tax=Nematocida homosporus TaxID=1912981 RepID=UPI0022200F2A|nr:H/ACA ribonucleoprotein complex subunit 1 [Nematocida homosporus]KAI5186564.1 H/ACA ribonucleoprotein complex subunit 1 [Nematocida homosporus]